jgi:hypothetical protein
MRPSLPPIAALEGLAGPTPPAHVQPTAIDGATASALLPRSKTKSRGLRSAGGLDSKGPPLSCWPSLKPNSTACAQAGPAGRGTRLGADLRSSLELCKGACFAGGARVVSLSPKLMRDPLGVVRAPVEKAGDTSQGHRILDRGAGGALIGVVARLGRLLADCLGEDGILFVP